MARILVTGGTGALGRELVKRLARAGHSVRLMSRGAPPERHAQEEVDWAQAELATGAGLPEAVQGVETIIHAATSGFKNTYGVDVVGTERLLEQARAAGTLNFHYISIVGIDRIPFGYYRHKLSAERLVEQAGLRWSILRATQFHTLVDVILRSLSRLPLMFLPTDFQFQLVDPGEVAQNLVAGVEAGQAGRMPDMGGPKVQRLGELARAWLTTREMRRGVVGIPLPGKVAAGFRRGFNTTPEHADGTITWEDWLQQTYGRGQEATTGRRTPSATER